MNKALVIYHANCDDGFGAAFAFWKYAAKNYDEVVYHPGIYGQPHPPVDRNTSVFVLDFSYSPELMVVEALQSKSYKVLDHHKTAKEAWDNWKEQYGLNNIPSALDVEFDMSRSGAMMALDFFANNDDCNILFEFLQDRDMWWFKNPHTKYFTRYLRSIPQQFCAWNYLAHALNSGTSYTKIIENGKCRLDEYESICKSIANHGKRRVWVNGIEGLECNCPGLFASDIGNLLAEESGTFSHTWELLDGRSKHSLRSIEDFDISGWAKELGGGGHKNAAGFTLQTSPGTSEEMMKYMQMFRLEGPF